MVGVPYDCLANPLGAVRLTFEKAVSSGSDPASFAGKDWGALDLFNDFLFTNGGLSQVPILNRVNAKYIQPNTLVRFRGMIQDMLGNEFYVGAYKDGSTWRTNKFTDVSQFPICSSPDMHVWERRLLYCVPVPGQNSWTLTSSEVTMDPCADSPLQHGEKRRREDDEDGDPMDMAIDDNSQGSPTTKKMKEEGHNSEASQAQEVIPSGPCSSSSMVPDTNKEPLQCLVKIYDSPESDLKLNDVFEFVGVFTSEVDLAAERADYDDLNDSCEPGLVDFPSNKVPCLHCIIYRRLGVNDFLCSFPLMEPKPQLVKGIREALLMHLTNVLGNDGVAAEFMLLHLLSKVHTRVDSLAVGKLSLNLTCFNKENMSVFGTRLSLALKSLLAFTHCIPLTLEFLNTASLAPKKEYQTNRLMTGALQLAEGTHLIIDETQLKAGTLNAVGVENVRLLKNLMDFQKVEYDFQYYKMEMATDVPLLIISEGKSNILPADLVLPFQPSSVGPSEILTEEAQEAWRWYLATIRNLPHSIKPEVQKVVESDLVTARQADRSLGSHDFSRLLTMGRLMSASFGETCLSFEHWQMVKELEKHRKERLK